MLKSNHLGKNIADVNANKQKPQQLLTAEVNFAGWGDYGKRKIKILNWPSHLVKREAEVIIVKGPAWKKN